jgi:hypothetical protein
MAMKEMGGSQFRSGKLLARLRELTASVAAIANDSRSRPKRASNWCARPTTGGWCANRGNEPRPTEHQIAPVATTFAHWNAAYPGAAPSSSGCNSHATLSMPSKCRDCRRPAADAALENMNATPAPDDTRKVNQRFRDVGSGST